MCPSGTTGEGGYAAEVARRFEPSRYVQSLPASPDPDPFSGPNVHLAERCLAYYRAGPDPRPYGSDAAFYPVPDHLHRVALEVTDRDYCSLEQLVGRFIFDAWRVTVPLLLLRSFCLSQLRNHLDPFATIRNQTRVRDVVAYLMDASQRGGVLVLSPKTPRPVTVVEYPWPPTVPDYDAVFERGMTDPALTEVADSVLGLEWPPDIWLDPVDMLDYLRSTLRGKKRLKKVRRSKVESDAV